MDFNPASNKEPELVNTLQEKPIPQSKKATIPLLHTQKGVKMIIDALKTPNLIATI
jgi:hypothetical protein